MLTLLAGLSTSSMHPPPAFGSSPNLEALAIEANKSEDIDGDNSVHANAQFSRYVFCSEYSFWEISS